MPLLCGAILTADATSLLLQPFKGIHSLAENEGAGDLPRSAVRSFVRSFVRWLAHSGRPPFNAFASGEFLSSITAVPHARRDGGRTGRDEQRVSPAPPIPHPPSAARPDCFIPSFMSAPRWLQFHGQG